MSTQQQLKQDIQQVASDVEQLMSQVNGQGSEMASSLKAKVTPMLVSARDSISQASTTVKGKAVDAAKKTDAYAHANPWQVAGIAALVGLSVGALATSRRR
jgi:ElaB/YqjD/DUF883 family membrane-anchored ribosome-binding protein